MNKNKEIEKIRLSKKITVKDYQNLVAERNKKEIANFIYYRFYERYIYPLENIPKKPNDIRSGFLIMAVCCLMIEALESFYQGLNETPRYKAKNAFHTFFARNDLFKDLSESNCSDDFYSNVRCGILHQAETKNGWQIIRKGPIFNHKTLEINATRFLNRLKKYLQVYCDSLTDNKIPEVSSWDSKIWGNLRKKMDFILENCKKS